MHFSQREQAALRDVGCSTDDLREASEAVVAATAAAADDIEQFLDREAVYSDMEMAHSTGDVQEHDLAFVDLYTHADDLRGYVRFDSWGVPVEGGRVLSADVVELELGPTIHDRVRFAADPEAL